MRLIFCDSVCAAGAVRLAIFFATPLNSADVTFNEAGTLYWTYIESAVAIIGACLPTLKPLFRGSLGGNTTAKASNGQWKSTTSKNLTDTGSFSQLRGEDGHQPNGHMTTVVTGHGHGHTQSDDESDRDIPMNQMGVRENNIIKTNKSWSTTYHTA